MSRFNLSSRPTHLRLIPWDRFPWDWGSRSLVGSNRQRQKTTHILDNFISTVMQKNLYYSSLKFCSNQ